MVVELTKEEMKARLYRLARIDERQIDVQKFKADIMTMMKMDPRKPVNHRILAVELDLIDYIRGKTLANVARPRDNRKLQHAKIVIDAIVVGIVLNAR